MSDHRLKEAFDAALKRLGEVKLLEELAKLNGDDGIEQELTLTIVANKGVHHLPREFLRGEVYYASMGSLDFSSHSSIERELEAVLIRLASKLKNKPWQRINLVPFGPTNLSILIKLLVYRVTHIETTDLFHMGAGKYTELGIQLREIVIGAS